ncbi:class C sortase [Alloscardovia theropitheci]|uniref:Class C sortase n=2 Tax=Alloscardovia theropitheci TaxID=2496842 RepID=A0A4R0QNS6_9BIFI|nr:class C sortase [Alloscardovia theropitheci]
MNHSSHDSHNEQIFSQSASQPNPQNTQKRKKANLIIAVGIFILGLGIFLYPTISNVYYTFDAQKEIADYDQSVKSISEQEIDKKIKLARAYNAALDSSKLVEPFTPSQKKEGIKEYARMLEVKEKIGYIDIPAIKQKLPIYAGTSDEVLSEGMGHMEGTSLPVGGPSTHTVLAGHRGLPDKKILTDADQIKKGDVFYIHTLNLVLAYKVNSIEVIEPNDFAPILVESGKDLASLLTCTPLGVNSHRLLITGYRIAYAPSHESPLDEIYEMQRRYIIACAISLCVIIALISMIFLLRKNIHTGMKNMRITNDNKDIS